jgi:hypothetical protein
MARNLTLHCKYILLRQQPVSDCALQVECTLPLNSRSQKMERIMNGVENSSSKEKIVGEA